MVRPEGETRRERTLQRIVGTGVVVIFVLLGTIVIQGIIQYRSQTNHHAATTAAQMEILTLLHTVRDAQITNKGTISDINSLEKEVAQVILALPAADAALIKEATALAEDVMALCAATPHASCPPLPPVPTG